MKGTKKEPDTSPSITVPERACIHDVWEVGIGYREETNPQYCSDGFDMFNNNCAVCKRKLVHKSGSDENGKDTWFKPSEKTKLYCCIAREASAKTEGCSHAVCCDCFVKEMKEYETRQGTIGKGSSRRTRT